MSYQLCPPDYSPATPVSSHDRFSKFTRYCPRVYYGVCVWVREVKRVEREINRVLVEHLSLKSKKRTSPIFLSLMFNNWSEFALFDNRETIIPPGPTLCRPAFPPTQSLLRLVKPQHERVLAPFLLLSFASLLRSSYGYFPCAGKSLRRVWTCYPGYYQPLQAAFYTEAYICQQQLSSLIHRFICSLSGWLSGSWANLSGNNHFLHNMATSFFYANQLIMLHIMKFKSLYVGVCEKGGWAIGNTSN